MRSQALDIYQGDDYTATVNVTQQGVAADLTGYTAAAQIRRAPADSDASVDATCTCTITGSTILVALGHTATTALSGCYVWDLQLTDGTGTVITIARGPVHVTPEVTR